MRFFKREGFPGQWEIRLDYPSKVMYPISRKIPGLKYHNTKLYTGYTDALRLFVSAWLEKGLRFPNDVPPELRSGWEEPPFSFPFPIANEHALRDYQKLGVEFILKRGPEGCIVADEMRLGKSVQALTAARALSSKTLVVCPNYVKSVWVDEIEKWWPSAKAGLFLPSGVKEPSLHFHGLQIVIINYEILHAWANLIHAWGPRVAVADECHILMNEKTKLSQGWKAATKETEIRVGLSGTPMTNRPRDLHNVIDSLSPGRMGDFFPFALKYCDAHEEDTPTTPPKTVWVFDGHSNEEELNQRLSHFMLRRTTDDVGVQLPPKQRQLVWVESKAPLSICSEQSGRALRASLDRAADAKLNPALELIRGHLKAHQKVVVACWRRQVADWLAQQIGGSALVIHGKTAAKDRARRLHLAKESTSPVALITTIDATALGVDFSFASIGVFVELTYEPHEILQWESRMQKVGKEGHILLQYVLAKSSSDELIAEAVIKKLDLFSQIIGKRGKGKGNDLDADLKATTEEALDEIYAMVAKMQAKEKGKKEKGGK